jgi:hypothetical protein
LIIALAYILILTLTGCALFLVAARRAVWKDLGRKLALAALVLPLSIGLAPNLYLAHLACFMIVPIFARSTRDIGAIYLLALLITPPLEQRAALGFVDLIPFTLQTSISLGALISVLIYGRAASTPARLDVAFVLILLVSIFMMWRGTSVTNLFRVSIDLATQYWIPYYVVSRTNRSWTDISRCMIGLSFAGCILGAIAVFEVARMWPLYRSFYYHHGVSLELLPVKLRDGLLRSGGPFLEPTSFAGALAVCALASWYSASAFRSSMSRWLIVGTITVGVLAPQGRAAILALLLGFFGAELYRRKAGLLGLLTFVGSALAVVLFLSQAGGGDGALMSSPGAETVDYRRNLFRRGLQEIGESPILGRQGSEVVRNMQDLVQGEGLVDFVNTYLYVALHAGLLGLLVWIVAVLTWPVLLWRKRNLAYSQQTVAAMSFLFAVQCIPLVRFSLSSFGARTALLFFAFLGLSVAAYSIARRAPHKRDRLGNDPKVGMTDHPACLTTITS